MHNNSQVKVSSLSLRLIVTYKMTLFLLLPSSSSSIILYRLMHPLAFGMHAQTNWWMQLQWVSHCLLGLHIHVQQVWVTFHSYTCRMREERIKLNQAAALLIKCETGTSTVFYFLLFLYSTFRLLSLSCCKTDKETFLSLIYFLNKRVLQENDFI